MKLDILCTDGSPLGVTPADIEGRGVGGAELALLTFFEVMTKRGHEVTVYNDSRYGESFRRRDDFHPDDNRDAVILFRGPHPKFQHAKGKHVFWSCDQYTIGNYKYDVFPYSDRIVTISDFHRNYFVTTYGVDIEKMDVINIGVRDEYLNADPPAKTPYSMLFCSVPDRGLQVLRLAWDLIVKKVPDASLTITSDYRLWGNPDAGNHQYRLQWLGVPNVKFFGKVPRSDLVRLQLASELQAYPCIYEELFCISVAECQVAGAVPVTSTVGALRTTNIYGKQVEGDPRSIGWPQKFAEEVCNTILWRDNLKTREGLCRTLGRTNFNWNVLAMLWEEVLS